MTLVKRFLPVLLIALAACQAARADLVVLQYHHVSDATPPSTSTSVSLFESQLDMIETLGMRVVPLQPGTEAALAGNAGDRDVALTFDDAYESVYTEAAPRLAERRYPYTVFVNTESVGRPGFMTWEQLAELAQDELVTLANHSADHAHLAKRPDESEDDWQQRVERSLDDAQDQLRQKLGTDTALFAYPYGEFDHALEQKIAERGWFGYGQQSGPIGPQSAATRLPRFPMANTYGQLATLKDKLLSKAFPVDASALPDGVTRDNPPTLTFRLPERLSGNRLSCFASGQGRIDIKINQDNEVVVRAPESFKSRRFRYNCTHPAGEGRFYWLSQQWLDLSQPED